MTADPVKQRIVLLSDNAFQRKLAKLALQALGARVVEAADLDGAERAAVVEDASATAVVVALREVEQDALAASRRLRARFAAEGYEPDDEPVVAVVSDRRDENARRRAADAGVDFTLIEPVDWAAFLQRLTALRAEAEEAARRRAREDRPLSSEREAPDGASQEPRRRHDRVEDDRDEDDRDEDDRDGASERAVERDDRSVDPARPRGGRETAGVAGSRSTARSERVEPPIGADPAAEPPLTLGEEAIVRPPRASDTSDIAAARAAFEPPPPSAAQKSHPRDGDGDGAAKVQAPPHGTRDVGADGTAPAELRAADLRAAASDDAALGPNRFLWRPGDGAFVCGSAAAAALGAPDGVRSLEAWTRACVAPDAETVRAALRAALEETGETLMVGSVQPAAGERDAAAERDASDDAPDAPPAVVIFGLFAERREDEGGRAVLSGAAHRVEAVAVAATASDAATGLPTLDASARALEAVVARAVAERRKCAILTLEIADFFEVAETFGAPEADRALRVVGERLADALRGGDMLARSGRAAFVVAQPDVKNAEDVRGLAARLAAAVSDPIDLGDASTRLRAVVGAAVGPDHGRNGGALIAASETALREAARSGRAMRLYDDLSIDPARARSTVRREVATALRDGAFELHYLPGVDATGAVTCLEALLRLRRGEGWVPPEDVVEVMEQSGDLAGVTARIFKLAARDLAVWRHAMGRAPRLAVNLTGPTLAEGGALAAAEAAMAEIDAMPDALRFEVTEKGLERRRAQAAAALAGARRAGVEIALDDFGARASSIDALAAFGFDRVKLSRALIAEPRRRGGPDLLAGTARLALEAGLKATAIGVADPAARARAFQLGLDEAQGYAVAPPAPIADLIGWFSRTRSAG